jgi:hypothetical protein
MHALVSQPDDLKYFANMFAKLHAQMPSLKLAGLPSQHQQLEKKIREAKPLPKNRRNAAFEALHKLQ